ncbi:MAG: methyltransferase, partial [Winogradskyella sp.]|nr:methyltransferase [Winogradskyella sp.]
MYEKTYPNKRFKLTLQFLKKHISTSESILDLGVSNPFSEIIIFEGYQVENTKGEDLDEDRSNIITSNTEVVTAFEIFEHLLSPYEVLKS